MRALRRFSLLLCCGLSLAAGGVAAARPRPSASPSAAPPPSPPTPADYVQRVDATHFRVARALVDQIRTDPARIQGAVRIVPVVSGGEPRGFKLFAVPPASVFAAAGLISGDVVAQIDGGDFTRPDDLVALDERLKTTDHFTLTIERFGASIEYTYTVAATLRPAGASPSPTPSGPTPAQLAKAVHKIDATHYRIDAGVGRAALDDGASLTRAARIVPAAQNGEVRGFKLYEIAPDGLFALCGLKNGDVVTHIDDRPVSSPTDVLAAYAAIAQATRIVLRVERGGKTLSIEYLLK